MKGFMMLRQRLKTGLVWALVALHLHAYADPATISYIHTDHLDTPRAVSDHEGNTIWRWDSDGFGRDAPTAQAGFTLALRLPGQYADVESGLHYNYKRDYDPSTARFVQSDPIGLDGGINTYAYVGGNPTGNADPDGLQAQPVACAIGAPFGGPIGCGVGIGIATAAPLVIAAGGALIMSASSSSGSSSGAGSNSAANCTPDNKDPCEEIRRKIRDIEQKLASKERQMSENKYDLYNRAYSTNPGGDLAGKGTWTGHMAQIEGLRIGLERAKAEARAKGCL